MLLTEFFSKNVDAEKRDDKDEDLFKDLMAYILDDDDIYKKLMLPIIDQTKKDLDKKTYKKNEAFKPYLELIKKACLSFYKKNELTGDPNKIFPIRARVKMAKQLAEINREGLSKDETKRAV